jgi:ankyrin repeat protein
MDLIISPFRSIEWFGQENKRERYLASVVQRILAGTFNLEEASQGFLEGKLKPNDKTKNSIVYTSHRQSSDVISPLTYSPYTSFFGPGNFPSTWGWVLERKSSLTSPLAAAVAVNNYALARLFILHQADPKLLAHKYGVGTDASHSLLYQATINHNKEIMKLLLEAGADPNEHDPSNGSSPLRYLVSYSNKFLNGDKGTRLELVDLLLRHGGGIHYRFGERRDYFPFEAAIKSKDEDLFNLLMSYPHLDKEFQEYKKASANRVLLDLPVSSILYEALQTCFKISTIRRVISKDLTGWYDPQGHTGLTPMGYVVTSGKLEYLKLLLASGVSAVPVDELIKISEIKIGSQQATADEYRKITNLLERYKANPKKIVEQCFYECADRAWPAEVWGLMAFFGDGCLEFKSSQAVAPQGPVVVAEEGEKAARTKQFFEIAQQLPTELQMLLAPRLYRSPKPFIREAEAQQALQYIASSFHQGL